MFNRRRRSRAETFGQVYALEVVPVTRWMLSPSIAALVRCFVCWETPCQLHHWTYERLGNERLEDLVWLCRRHHQGVHTAHEQKDAPLHRAHVDQRAHYLFNQVRPRLGELTTRTQAAVDQGRFSNVSGTVAFVDGWLLDDHNSLHLRFRTREDQPVDVVLTFPDGVTAEVETWQLRPYRHAAA
jgi:hypothetical protein